MDFSNYTALHLNFNHAYAQRATLKDSLIVKISPDCGNTWTRILATGPDNNNPNVFATHANTLEAFYPQSSEDWCGSSYGTACYSLDISAWAGLANVKIMFESFNRYGNNLLGSRHPSGATSESGSIRILPAGFSIFILKMEVKI
jgi:hypothetical protein